MIGLIVFAILQLRRIKLCRGQLFYNVVKIMCNKYNNVFAPGTLGNQPETYLVPVNCMLGLGVWHIDARWIYHYIAMGFINSTERNH